jgi:hypothetical protein
MLSKLGASLALFSALTFGAGTAFANKYINDINWSQLKCIVIPGLVQDLEHLGDALDDAADEARHNGQDGLATVYQTAANEAHLEADEGKLAYQTGNCKP